MSSKSRKTPRTLLNLFDSADSQLLQSVENGNGPEPKRQADTSRNKVQTSEVPHDTERGAARYCGAGSCALRVHREARPGGESRWQMRNRAPSSYPQDTIHNHGIPSLEFTSLGRHPTASRQVTYPLATLRCPSLHLPHPAPYERAHPEIPTRWVPPHHAHIDPPCPRSEKSACGLAPRTYPPTNMHNPARPPENTTACLPSHQSPPIFLKNPPHRNTKHTRTRSNLIWFRVAG
jgi:hypothetical protein